MFDISFSELLVIAVVALLVIGPEKLPKVARTAGTIFGRMQRYVAQVTEEVNREARFAELQKLQDEIRQGADAVKSSIAADIEELQTPLEPADTKPKVRRVRKKAAVQSDAKPKTDPQPRARGKKSVP